MNPEGIPYFSPGFPNPGSTASPLDFNPEWLAYRRATNGSGRTRVRGRRSSRLPLPVVAMGSVPHIYRREGHSPGDPKDVAPFRGTT